MSSVTPMMIDVTGLVSNVSESSECSVAPDVLQRADGFFTVHARAQQRWHFHLDPVPNQNLAVFAAGSCDPRECVAAADVCGVNESEHFTFVADRAGDYVVVLDGIEPGSTTPLRLLAISPECGDGTKVHGEVCDDGNLTNGDGCDNACRVELNGARVDEVEPNDDSYLANVVTADPSTPVGVNGKIGGNVCQPDNFLIRLPKSGLLNLKVTTGAGAACTDAPALDLTLSRADSRELREDVQIAHNASSGGACPEIALQALQAGTYYVRLSRGAQGAPQFEYQIQVSLTTPAP
ncbi:MAG: myxococcus cysteine-rich repeat containing protein [Myxococcales bacterium]